MKIYKRSYEKKILSWKNKALRKPLLLIGARQVGKTSILKNIGSVHFPKAHYFDFQKDQKLHLIFAPDSSPQRIVNELELHLGHSLDLTNDLIIFDEIQNCPQALASLKYFAEDFPQSFIAAAGSLLGVYLNSDKHVGFPVGKVETHYLYPLSFAEYVLATETGPLANALEDISFKNPPTPFVHKKFLEKLFEYFIIGGMPEVISIFEQYKAHPIEAYTHARCLQKELIENYKGDISKHSGKIKAVKIEAVLNSIPKQLAAPITENKKFVFKDLLSGPSNFGELEAPIEWLIKAGLAYKVPIIEKAEIPLGAYSTPNRFKLYLFDIGLLGAMLDLSPLSLLKQNYGQFKGYFAENFVLQQLTSFGKVPVYCWQKGKSEIDFIITGEESPVPIEVKAGINLKAKILANFIQKYSPQQTVLLSLEQMGSDQIYQQLPLYLAHQVPL